MKSWKAMVEIIGLYHDDGATFHPEIKFNVSEKLYKKIASAIKTGKKLYKCGFYEELVKRAEDAFDLEEYVIDEIMFDKGKPVRDDFDNEEEYQEAVQEYEEALSQAIDTFTIDNVTIYDPTEEKKFKERYIGKILPEEERDGDGAGSKEFEFKWEKIMNTENGVIL